MNSAFGLEQNPAFQGKYLLRLPGKNGQTFLTTIKTKQELYNDIDIVEITGKGIYKGKLTGENFHFKNSQGFSYEEFANIAAEIQSKVKDTVNAAISILAAKWADGRRKLGEMVQVIEP